MSTDTILQFLREWRHYNGFDSKELPAGGVRMSRQTWNALILCQWRRAPGWDSVKLEDWRKDGRLIFGIVTYTGELPTPDVVASFDDEMESGEFIFM